MYASMPDGVEDDGRDCLDCCPLLLPVGTVRVAGVDAEVADEATDETIEDSSS